MHWLLELILDLIHLIFPWGHRHTDRSFVGESRMDRQARIIAWVVISVIVTGALTFYFITTK